MHDQVVTIQPGEGVKGVDILFTHAAFFRLERDHGFTPMSLAARLQELSSVAIEAALVAGLEGHRERAGGRPTPWSPQDVRALLDGPLAQLSQDDLASALLKALTAGLRRGKAPAPTPPAP